MACYELFMVFGILVLAVCSNGGLESGLPEQPEDHHQEEDIVTREGLPIHDMIRHYRQKSKCKLMMTKEDCQTKYKPANGTVSLTRSVFGWRVDVRCHRGYSLQGPFQVLCFGDMREHERSFCKIKDCGEPMTKTNTKYTYNTTTYESKLLVECDREFDITGSPRSKCLASGKWSNIATCVQKVTDESTVAIDPSLIVISLCSGIGMSIIGVFILRYLKRCMNIKTHGDELQPLTVDQTTHTDAELSISIEPTKPSLLSIPGDDTIQESCDSGCSDTYISSIDTLEQSGSSFSQHSVPDVEGLPHSNYGVFEQSGSHVVNPTDEVPSTSDVTSSLSAPVHAVCRELEIPLPNKISQLPTCRVTPLKAGDEQANDAEISQQHTETGQELAIKEKDSPADASELNWNKLFSYLVPKLCTVDWRLFAVELLSRRLPHGQSADKTVSQIEARSKTQHGGEKIESILLKIFWYWKDLKKSASLHDIEAALVWAHYEDVNHNMKDVVRTFYEPIDELDGNLSLNQNVLAGIPELQYRIEPKESEIALLPCFEERANTHEMVPVTPFTEERMTCDYRFAASAGLHYHSDKRFNIAKRQYSYIKYQKLCNRYKFPERNRIPPRRRKPKAKPKVEVNNAMTVPRSGEVLSFTEVDTTCVQLIYNILDLDPNRELNPTEFRLLTKHVLYKIHKTTPKHTEFNDILGITFEEFSLCDHVSTPKNCSLHIINSAKVMVILKDEEWSLVEKYVRRARNVVVQREPEIEQPHLFLTYEGYQVTNEYLQVNIKRSATAERTNGTECKDGKAALDTSDKRSNDTETERENKTTFYTGAERTDDTESKGNKTAMDTSAERTNDTESKDTKTAMDTSAERTNDTESKDNKTAMDTTAERTNDTETKDCKAALDTSDQTDAMDTDKANEPPKVTLAQRKNQKLDVKRKLPLSRRSNYGGHANKVTTGSDVQVRHGRRYFCEKQTVTIETVFKEDIRQGSVKESTILSRFLNCNDLREAFGVESNNVDKILVKKVADRVRCFIRRRKN